MRIVSRQGQTWRARQLENPTMYGVMQKTAAGAHGGLARYSAKRMLKPVNFFCTAPEARQVSVIGDFNEWQPDANPMRRQPDGGWATQVPLHHGHHLYLFLVDGQPLLDPRAQGYARNVRNERVSMIAVS